MRRRNAPGTVLSAVGLSAAGSSAAGPSAAGPSAAGPSAAGPSATGPSATGRSAAGPSAVRPSAVGLSALGHSALGLSALGLSVLRLAAFGLAAAALLAPAGCGGPDAPAPKVLRIGHFPNLTHAQGLVAHASSRRGSGFLEQRLGDGVRVEWHVFDAGQTAMRALRAGSLDATYVGPNPALAAHADTRGEEVRVLAGAARGGAALVVRNGAGIHAPGDLRKRTIATPQVGNTQDVCCRAWLREQGFDVTLSGIGDVTVQAMPNAAQLAAFQKGELDAAWTVEPWVARLELEGGGRILVADRDTLTTVLVASSRFVREQPELASHLVAAHRELTSWMVENPEAARAEVRGELRELTGSDLSESLLAQCWTRLRFTTDVDLDAFQTLMQRARNAGFLVEEPDLGRFLHRR